MNKSRGIGWMATGLLLIAAALCLTIYNLWDDARADRSAQVVEDALSAAIAQRLPAGEGETPDYVRNPEMEMPTAKVDGHDCIGILEVPALDLRLPVISTWSYPSLRIAPCRYAGSAYLDNLVIAAHNYQRHFGGIKDLNIGEMLTFTDVDGNIFSYTVKSVELLQPTAVEEMESGDWDLTLFTCTLGGRTRVTVRCERR